MNQLEIESNPINQSINQIRVVADLPGYGYAKISKEGQRGIEDFMNKYLSGRLELGLVVLLVDCRLDAQEADREVLHGAYLPTT